MCTAQRAGEPFDRDLIVTSGISVAWGANSPRAESSSYACSMPAIRSVMWVPSSRFSGLWQAVLRVAEAAVRRILSPQDAVWPHTLRIDVQNLDISARTLHTRSDPSNAGTKQLTDWKCGTIYYWTKREAGRHLRYTFDTCKFVS